MSPTRWLIALLSALLSCAAFGSPDRGLDHEARADTAMRAYQDCLVDYARRYARANAAPRDIADGAGAECEPRALSYWQAMYDFGRANVREGVAKQMADEAADYIRTQSVGTVTNEVLRIRSEPQCAMQNQY